MPVKYYTFFLAAIVLMSSISCHDNSQKSDSAITIEDSYDTITDNSHKSFFKSEKSQERLKEEDFCFEPINCNIDVIVQLKNNMDSPSDSVISMFYHTFDKECENNVEYLVFSNEVLHELFYRHTTKSLILLSNEKIDFSLIVKELKNPVTDKYELMEIYQKIKETPDSLSSIRVMVLQDLKVN